MGKKHRGRNQATQSFSKSYNNSLSEAIHHFLPPIQCSGELGSVLVDDLEENLNERKSERRSTRRNKLTFKEMVKVDFRKPPSNTTTAIIKEDEQQARYDRDKKIILSELEGGNSLTVWQLFKEFAITDKNFRLIIEELESLGYILKQEWVTGIDNCNCLSYSLAG